MGYSLYIRKKDVDEFECGGKCYGYKGVGYKGAAYLYFVNKSLRDYVDFFYEDIKNVEKKMRHFFKAIPDVEIEITGEQYLLFLKFYKEDAIGGATMYFDERKIDPSATYVLKW